MTYHLGQFHALPGLICLLAHSAATLPPCTGLTKLMFPYLLSAGIWRGAGQSKSLCQSPGVLNHHRHDTLWHVCVTPESAHRTCASPASTWDCVLRHKRIKKERQLKWLRFLCVGYKCINKKCHTKGSRDREQHNKFFLWVFHKDFRADLHFHITRRPVIWIVGDRVFDGIRS